MSAVRNFLANTPPDPSNPSSKESPSQSFRSVLRRGSGKGTPKEIKKLGKIAQAQNSTSQINLDHRIFNGSVH